METKHTPLPWHRPAGPLAIFSGKGGRLLCDMHDNSGGMLGVSTEEQKANAAFIVRACNSHYELVEALESALEYLAPSKGFADLDRAVFVIRAALAKAKGE